LGDNLIYYLLALILGLVVGILFKDKDIPTNKLMYIVLLFLIFFLGVNIGNTLDLQELSQVGVLSLVFALTTIAFSYIFSKAMRGV